MKLVREYINEKFIENSDPIQDMGIGELAQLQELFPYIALKDFTPNQLFIIGLNRLNVRIDDRIKLMKYALRAGANNLWYKRSAFFPPRLIPAIFKVVDISKDRYNSLDVKYKSVWNVWNEPLKTYKCLDMFDEKFVEIDEETLEKLDHTIESIKNLKKVIPQLINK